MRDIRYDYIKSDWKIKVDKVILEMIGIELKRRRMMQSKNLSDYNCEVSISYLSKIENAKIVPKYSVLKDFCSQNGISSKELEAMMEIDDKIKKIIDAIVENNRAFIDSEFMSAKAFNNYKFALYKGFYYYVNNDFDSLKSTLSEIVPIEKKLQNFDFNICLFFKMTMANNEKRFFDVVESYQLKKDFENTTLDLLIKREYVRAVLLSGFRDGIYLYRKFYEECYNNRELINQDFKDDLEYSLAINSEKLSSKTISNLSIMNKIIYFHQIGDYKSLFDLSKKHLSPLERFYFLFYSRRFDEAEKTLEKISEELSQTDKMMAEVYILTYDLKNKDTFDLVYNKVSPLIHYLHNVFFIEYLIDVTFKTAIKWHRYKDATMFLYELSKRKRHFGELMRPISIG